MAELRTPKSALGNSINTSKEQTYISIRDELSKNPKRKHNVVEAFWLDNPQ